VDSNAVGTAEAFPASATASGTLSALAVYLDTRSTATNIVVGLYRDNGSGHPGTLIVQGSKSNPIKAAWNTVFVSATPVTAGTQYWMVILGTGSGRAYFRDRKNGPCRSESSSQTSLTSLPGTWTTGQLFTDCPLSGFGQ
jgi:hypothetical protein